MDGKQISLALMRPLENYGLLLDAAKDPDTASDSLEMMAQRLIRARQPKVGWLNTLRRPDDSIFLDLILLDQILAEVGNRTDLMPRTYECISMATDSILLMGVISRNTSAPTDTRMLCQEVHERLQIHEDVKKMREEERRVRSVANGLTPSHVRKLLSIR